MNALDMAHNRKLDADTVNRLLNTGLMVYTRPTEYSTGNSWMYSSVCGKRDDPEDSHIGLRVVPGNASGEARWCDNRPARNPKVDELVDEVNELDGRIYVPIQWVLAALEADDLDDLLEDDVTGRIR